MRRRANGWVARSAGSLSSGAPGGILALAPPEKRSVRSLPGIRAPDAVTSATRAAPTASGCGPYSLESRRRRRWPPADRRTTWTIVWLLKLGVIGRLLAMVVIGGAGEAAQLPI